MMRFGRWSIGRGLDDAQTGRTFRRVKTLDDERLA